MMALDGFDRLTDPATLQLALGILAKLGIGAICGGAVGYEREIHRRPAGIRTHMLIVVGVVLFSEVSKAFAPNDAARIAAQVVTGIGFLGAGSILRLGVEVKGLTSAASIWAVAAVGMAISAGNALLWVALAGTILTLVTLTLVDNFERRFVPFAHPRSIHLELKEDAEPQATIGALVRLGFELSSVRVRSKPPKCVLEVGVNSCGPKVLSDMALLDDVDAVRMIDY